MQAILLNGRRRLSCALALAVLGLTTGCTSTIGGIRLRDDQLTYSRALGDAEKGETLLNVVRIRYGDTPTFLQATQVISGYQLQRGVSGGFQILPDSRLSNFFSATGSAQFSQTPTFTFQPLSGEQFAQSFIRPLAPATLLPLAMSGLPIDLLFRLGVQSVNGYSNAVALATADAGGAPEFFELIQHLRRLQIAGILSVRVQQPGAIGRTGGTEHKSDAGGLFLSIAPTSDEDLRTSSATVRRLLGVAEGVNEIEVAYGGGRFDGKVSLLTRSMLGVLSQVGIQIDVPGDDVARGRTLPTVGSVGVEKRPVVIVKSGAKAPADAFTSVQYHQTWYWIDDDDFDSKLAFTVLQVLLALSRTASGPGAVVTIPAH